MLGVFVVAFDGVMINAYANRLIIILRAVKYYTRNVIV